MDRCDSGASDDSPFASVLATPVDEEPLNPIDGLGLQAMLEAEYGTPTKKRAQTLSRSVQEIDITAEEEPGGVGEGGVVEGERDFTATPKAKSLSRAMTKAKRIAKVLVPGTKVCVFVLERGIALTRLVIFRRMEARLSSLSNPALRGTITAALHLRPQSRPDLADQASTAL
jgi:hypothetical protein